MSNNILLFPRAPYLCHSRVGHNMSSPNVPIGDPRTTVIPAWATICHPKCTYRGSTYHRHSGMGLAGIQENVIPMSVSEEESFA